MVILGIDTGGTFTDFIYKDNDGWNVYKILSTPTHPEQAVIEGIDYIAGRHRVNVTHGSTVATNAILERKGAHTALITNQGFEDVLEIGRQNRRYLYRLFAQKPAPLVPARYRYGIACRVARNGQVIAELDATDLAALEKKLRRDGIESLAVSFLFSFNNPTHEQTVRASLSGLDIPISLSHEILSEFREFERTATTVLNAYVAPRMGTYLSALSRHEKIEHLRIMQSNGGAIRAETAVREPVRTVLSGPAGGVVGAFEIGKRAGCHHLITFDMGGTSTDVALIDSRLPLTTDATIAGFPVKVPSVDIHTVGAGGGSIAAYDAGGSLKVGPGSAGATPGPICYGHGEQITVTDAHLLLGRILPDHFLGGHMRLQPKRLGPYFEAMAKPYNLSPEALAQGVLDVANSAMERAIRVISVERGHDPREFTLFSFGGAGGMHAVDLARLLGIPQVLIPPNPGILSAIGMLLADTIKDYSRTVMRDQQITDDALQHLFTPMEEQAKKALAAEGITAEHVLLEHWLDMRYQGQAYEILVPFDTDFIDRFHREHQKTYGYANSQKPVEIVNIRLRARGTADKPAWDKQPPAPTLTPPARARLQRQSVCFDGRRIDTPIWDRTQLAPGHRIQGPAIFVEYSATTVIPPDASVEVDDYANLLITLT